MAPLIYKPRPKLRSWTPSQVPKPKRSYFYRWAVLAWLLVIALGYHWLPIDWTQRQVEEESTAVSRPNPVDSRLGHAAQRTDRGSTADEAPSNGEAQGAQVKLAPPSRATPSNPEILRCEDFTRGQSAMPESRLPTHLGRSALDAFIGPNDWAKPCRGKQRQLIHLCVAIENGSVRGLTAKTARPNLTLEACLREQAKKLVLPPEETLRIVNTTFSL